MGSSRSQRPHPQTPPRSRRAGHPARTLSRCLERLIAACHGVSGQQRVDRRLADHLRCRLLCCSRHTIARLICCGGRQQHDWTADYRLYSHARVDPQQLFAVVRKEVDRRLPPQEPLVVSMDDSILRKCGTKIPGVAWRVDPLSPPFRVNFVRAQRVVQLSAALPFGEQGAAQSIPVDFVHAPTPQRPGRHATEEQCRAYRQLRRKMNINTVGLARLRELAQSCQRPLWVSVDGRFTNGTVFKGLPVKVGLIGRLRRDARLYTVPETERCPGQGGRPRHYGTPLPTPEEVLRDPGIPYLDVDAYAAGRQHRFRVKTLAAVKWKAAGAARVLRLIVIAPLAYRPCQRSKLLYRQPAYLVCSDPQLPLQQVLQAYLWRWGIEVNFRDEKSVLGVGQAQVRHPQAVERTAAVGVADYSLLLLAGIAAYGPGGTPHAVPPPKWLRGRPPRLCPTQRLIAQLRLETWGGQITAEGFQGFWNTKRQARPDHKGSKPLATLASAVIHAQSG